MVVPCLIVKIDSRPSFPIYQTLYSVGSHSYQANTNYLNNSRKMI